MKVHFVVNAAIWRNDRILLEKKPNGYWKLPGGHLEKDETPEEALIREIKEELGCTIKFIDYPQLFSEPEYNAFGSHNPICTFSHTVDSDNHLKKKHLNFGFIYLVRPTSTIKPLEGQEIIWIAQSEVNTCEISRGIKSMILRGFQFKEQVSQNRINNK